MLFDDSIGNITLKPKSCSSTNKFQKNERENYIAINNEDSKQIIKMCCSSLHQMDSMIKNMHKSWSLIG
jgi:hypothetical protein